MTNGYSFKQATCYCGLDLADKKVAVAGYRRGTTPEGECPGCGRALVIDAPALEHPLDEPAIEPVTSPKKGRGKPEPEPE